MLKNNRRHIASMLCLALLSSSTAICNAESAISLAPESVSDENARAQWQKQLKRVESERTTAYVAGGIGLAAGTVLLVAGIGDKNSAQDTDGCSSSGYQITCNDQQQADEAQSKINQGNKKILLGAIVSGAGLILCAIGINRGNRLQELKVEGMRRQFVWDVEFNKDNDPMLVAKMSF